MKHIVEKCEICGGEIIIKDVETYGVDMYMNTIIIKMRLIKCKDCNVIYDDEIIGYKVE